MGGGRGGDIDMTCICMSLLYNAFYVGLPSGAGLLYIPIQVPNSTGGPQGPWANREPLKERIDRLLVGFICYLCVYRLFISSYRLP